jgi:hypothetical protein
MTNNTPNSLSRSELEFHQLFPQYSLSQKYYVYRHNDFCKTQSNNGPQKRLRIAVVAE